MFGDVGVALQQTGVLRALIVRALGNLLGQPFLLPFQLVQLAEGCQGLVDDRTHGVGHHLLRQVAHRLAAGHDEGAAFGFLPAAENLQQSGFTRPIHTNKADPIVVGDVECDVFKKVSAGKLNREIINAYHPDICWSSRSQKS